MHNSILILWQSLHCQFCAVLTLSWRAGTAGSSLSVSPIPSPFELLIVTEGERDLLLFRSLCLQRSCSKLHELPREQWSFLRSIEYNLNVFGLCFHCLWDFLLGYWPLLLPELSPILPLAVSNFFFQCSHCLGLCCGCHLAVAPTRQ